MSSNNKIENAPRFPVHLLSALVLMVALTDFSCAVPQSVSRAPAVSRPVTQVDAVAGYYQGDTNTSIADFETLSIADPGDPAPLRELIYLFEESGRYDRAISALNMLDRIEPDTPAVAAERFIVMCLSGKYQLAKALLPVKDETARTVFYEAYLFMRTGDNARAISLLQRSIELQERNPVAWYFLGTLLAAKGDQSGAEHCFNTTLKQDSDLTIAIAPLAESILAQGNYQEGYPLLLRARNILSDHTKIDRMIGELEKSHPELVQNRKLATAVRERTTIAPHVVSLPGPAEETQPVRVGLARGLTSVSVKTGGNYTLRGTVGGQIITSSGAGDELLVVKQAPDGVSISDSSGRNLFSSSGSVSLDYTDPTATTVIFDLLTEKGSFYASTEDRSYRGRIQFFQAKEGLTVVNTLPMEAYLYAVLPSEMPAYWPEEALKAQAVAARSYTLASLGQFASRGYDVQGSVTSASYRGAGGESPRTTEAVQATRGEVLRFEGKPLLAFYGANSGGYTEDSRVVWGVSAGMQAVPDGRLDVRTSPLPPAELAFWLEADPPAYCATPRYYTQAAYRWEKWVAAAEISTRVRSETDIGDILSVVPRGRGISGRVEEVEITGTRGSVVVKGDRIRSVLGGLRSTLFVSRPLLDSSGRPLYFIFIGGGWGHGVGMDQSGAAGMATAGLTYREILLRYYPLAQLGP